MKHTPAPWKRNGCMTIDAHDSTSIAYVSNTFRTRDEVIANGHLIAAAPDMLEALLEAAVVLKASNGGNNLKLVHEAIQKALGGDECTTSEY